MIWCYFVKLGIFRVEEDFKNLGILVKLVFFRKKTILGFRVVTSGADVVAGAGTCCEPHSPARALPAGGGGCARNLNPQLAVGLAGPGR